MEKKYFINIGRQLGSGGKLIGQLLAKELNIPIYDRTLIDMAAQESGLCKEVFEDKDEETGLLSKLFNIHMPFMNTSFYGNQLSDEALFKIQSDAIRHLSEKGSCIFVGRCADYILRDEPHVINIFITADEADRIRRIRERHPEFTEEQARTFMHKADHKRSSYYNYYSTHTWGHAATYHLCLNSSTLGIEGTMRFIKSFIESQRSKIEG